MKALLAIIIAALAAAAHAADYYCLVEATTPPPGFQGSDHPTAIVDGVACDRASQVNATNYERIGTIRYKDTDASDAVACTWVASGVHPLATWTMQTEPTDCTKTYKWAHLPSHGRADRASAREHRLPGDRDAFRRPSVVRQVRCRDHHPRAAQRRSCRAPHAPAAPPHGRGGLPTRTAPPP